MNTTTARSRESAIETPDTGLSVEAIRREITGTTIGQLLHVYGTIDSTNARLARLAAGGAPDGTVVIADEQTAARGRRGARWFSPPGVNLYVSVLFRRPLTIEAAPVFTFIASIALVDAVDELGLHAVIKWPNDVLVDGKKVAGTLVECATRGDTVHYLILGVGVNLNVAPADLVAALGPAGRFAGSLGALTGDVIDRNAFAAAYLRALDEWAQIHEARGAAAVLAAWRDRDILGGRRVDVREADGSGYEGRALGVADGGALVVQDTRGRRHEVTTGEVRLAD
jgi:BirA family biotin operon repressor/biotin-[acetyl-CoA-carboxylase] ligase